MFSDRTNWKLSQNELSIKLGEMKKAGFSIIDLTESNPTHAGFDYFNQKLLSPLTNLANLTYEPNPRGLFKTRETIANYYKEKNVMVNPDQIFLTSSTSEAYSALFRLLLNPGERVLVPQPSYPLFGFLGDLNDISLDPYHLNYNGDWDIDFESIESSYHQNTKALLVVNPNNPTGSFLKKNEFEKMVEFASCKSMAIISDEVFSDYGFEPDEKRVVSVAENSEALTFSLGGASKCLGLPQMKLSWIVVNGPPELTRQATERLEVIFDTYLSVNTPVQHSLASWFLYKNEIQTEILKRVQSNLSYLAGKTLKEKNVSVLKAEGGWYAILKIPDTFNEDEWVLKFLEGENVLVHPGYFFDFREEVYIVLSLLPEPKYFQEGIDRIFRIIRKI